MSSLSSLRKAMSDLDSVAEEINGSEKKKFTKPEKDTRYWSVTRDDAGNGYAVIRFLPPAKVDGDAGRLYVQIWDHGFHGPRGKKGPWYIEKSLTTIGRPDPVSEYNSKLWNSGVDANKDVARSQKRRLKYHSNILVINDPANPENNGKVFLFAYGKKLHEKIKNAMAPTFAGEAKYNPFDFWKGADFKLKVRMGSNNYPTYEDSAFIEPAPLLGGDDAKLDAIWSQEYSLTDLLDEKNFKSYDELKASLNRVLELTDEVPSTSSAPASTPSPTKLTNSSTTVRSTTQDDPALKSFASLLED